MNRRECIAGLAGFLAGSPLLDGLPQSQPDVVRDSSRVPGLNELLTSFDFETVAYAKQPRTSYDYPAYGVDGEFTMRRNRQAFDWVELVPKRLAGGAKPDTSTQIFGQKLAFPFFVSPTGSQGLLHADGDQAMHKGAAAANTLMAVSNNSSFPFDKVAAAAPSPLWVQLYPKQALDANQQYLDSCQAAGAKAVVVTIDQQASSYERNMHDRNLGGRGGGGGGSRFANIRPANPPNPYRVSEARLWYEWKFFDDIRPMAKVPILAKGILTGEDAKLCMEHGVDAIYVSNHGGRSLDYGPSTLEVLPEIVDAVGGKVPVVFDSGVRRGTDILKALALGATAVALGRVPLWGLGSFGPQGVQRVLEIMQAEFIQAMQFTGAPNIAAINRKLVRMDLP
jgi:isopentenyl diphosphate isomerase/L-lactate dehydrogenase-like FMN-dependent dehydrogenase